MLLLQRRSTLELPAWEVCFFSFSMSDIDTNPTSLTRPFSFHVRELCGAMKPRPSFVYTKSKQQGSDPHTPCYEYSGTLSPLSPRRRDRLSCTDPLDRPPSSLVPPPGPRSLVPPPEVEPRLLRPAPPGRPAPLLPPPQPRERQHDRRQHRRHRRLRLADPRPRRARPPQGQPRRRAGRASVARGGPGRVGGAARLPRWGDAGARNVVREGPRGAGGAVEDEARGYALVSARAAAAAGRVLGRCGPLVDEADGRERARRYGDVDVAGIWYGGGRSAHVVWAGVLAVQ